jgi:hypothetical protein
MSKKLKPSSDYIWFQISEYNENVYIHLTWENNKYVKYFYDDKVSPSLISREEINAPRNGGSLSSIMQSTFFEFMMYSI